jgi:hypothetical protein
VLFDIEDDDYDASPEQLAATNIWTLRLLLAYLEDSHDAIKAVLDEAVQGLDRVDVLQGLVLSLVTWAGEALLQANDGHRARATKMLTAELLATLDEHRR